MRTLPRTGLGLAAAGLAAASLAVVPQLGSAAPSKGTQTLRLVAHSTGSHNVPPNGFLGSDVDRSPKTNKIVGYDSITGHFNAKTGVVKIDAALALDGGVITAHLRGMGASNKLNGRITGGTGMYKGIHGKIHTHGGKITHITLRYHF
jgi:hypothetical protein